MVKSWNQFWASIAMLFTATHNVVTTLEIATAVARDEADGQSQAMAISRQARHAVLMAEANAMVAALPAPVKSK